jgi:hypothetical protein
MEKYATYTDVFFNHPIIGICELGDKLNIFKYFMLVATLGTLLHSSQKFSREGPWNYSMEISHK